MAQAPDPREARFLAEYQRLLDDPAELASNFENTLSSYGDLLGFVGDGRSLRSEQYSAGDPKQLVIGVMLNEPEHLLVPSAYFAKDFGVAFKERMEAGEEVAAVFDLDVDGTGRLHCIAAAHAAIDPSTGLVTITRRGALAGFVR